MKSINDFSKPFGPLLVVVNLDPTNPLLLKKDIPKERIEFQWIESIPPQVIRVTGFYLKLSEGETVDFPHSILITGRHQFELPLLCSVYLAQRGVAYMGLRAHEICLVGQVFRRSRQYSSRPIVQHAGW